MELELVLNMFNIFHYLFNRLVLNRRNTDSRTVCHRESALNT